MNTTFKTGDNVTRLSDRVSGKIEKVDLSSKLYRYLVRFKPHWVAWCGDKDIVLTSSLKNV